MKFDLKLLGILNRLLLFWVDPVVYLLFKVNSAFLIGEKSLLILLALVFIEI